MPKQSCSDRELGTANEILNWSVPNCGETWDKAIAFIDDALFLEGFHCLFGQLKLRTEQGRNPVSQPSKSCDA